MTRNEFNFVIDTNVIISALLFRSSVARQSFDKALNNGYLLQSFETIGELDNVLRREKFNKYVTETERLQFLGELVAQAKLIQIVETTTACRDPKDDKFLELAISGKANFIISGDQDLQVLHPFRDIPILSPTAFLALELKNT
jgi:putative PIN family toxin of toxin-antitoxin system